MRQFVTRFVTTLSLVAVLAAISATPALAQDAGLRGGVSIDPDQFYFGGHIETSPLVDRLHFRPNVEVGIGEDLMLIGANMEFVYKFPQRGGWGFYAGAGPALNVIMIEDVDDSNVEAGVNVLLGVESSRGLFFEFKIGVLDSPDYKFGVGYTWR
jgi:hypothetical protein